MKTDYDLAPIRLPRESRINWPFLFVSAAAVGFWVVMAWLVMR